MTTDPYVFHQLRLAWMDLRTSGTEYITASELRKYITDLKVKKNSENIAGLQVADLVVSPIGHHILGKESKEDWRIIQDNIWDLVWLFYLEKEKRHPNDSVTALLAQDFI